MAVHSFVQRDAGNRINNSVGRPMIAVYILLTVFVVTIDYRFSIAMIIAWLPAIFLGVVAYPFSSGFDRNKLNRVRTMALASLSRHIDVIAVAAIAGAVLDRSENVREAAVWSLEQYAKRLECTDYALAPPGTTESLLKLLKSQYTNVVGSALVLIDKLGNGSAHRYVLEFSKNCPDHGIRSMAESMLPTLDRRQQLEKQSSTLLRPSQFGSPESTLLRPIGASRASNPDELLRPSQDSLSNGDTD